MTRARHRVGSKCRLGVLAQLVAASPDPACLATRIDERGAPLSYELVRASLPAQVDALGAELARFLANLHAPQILALAPTNSTIHCAPRRPG